MAIRVRRGDESDFDASKMLPAEFAVCTNSGKVFVCTSQGKTKELASVEELQSILDASDEAYQAFLELMEQMDNDAVVTGLLADVSNLKAGSYTISFSEAEQRANIENTDTMKVILGKLRKIISDFSGVAFSGKYSDLTNEDIETATALTDNSTFIFDTGGTPKKITWANVFGAISDGIKAKILEWTFTNLGTTDKTIIGAVNELNMNMKMLYMHNGRLVNTGDDSLAALISRLVRLGYYNGVVSTINFPEFSTQSWTYIVRWSYSFDNYTLVETFMCINGERKWNWLNLSNGTWQSSTWFTS